MQDLYVEKYMPKTLDDMILNKDLREFFQAYIDKNNIPHMTLYGRPGIGKSKLAKILSTSVDADVIYINGSYDNNVDMIRTKVKNFCDALSDKDFKIVIIDEADSLTKSDNGAMMALKNIIEENQSDTRFILTANNIYKIIDAIQSRCRPISILYSFEDVVARLIQIIKTENLQISKSDLQIFVNTIVKKKFPDIRTIINEFEFWTVNGTIKPYTHYESDLDEIIEKIKTEKNPREIRKYLIQNEVKFANDYISLAQELFNKVDTSEEQLIIADALYKMALELDKEIVFAAMLIQMKELK